MDVKYLRFTSPEVPIIKFNDSHHPHYAAKLVYNGERGFTVGHFDYPNCDACHAKTEILNFDILDNNKIIGTWADINVDFPNAQYIRQYAALAVNSSIYLFGGHIDGYSSDRIVVFENNNYEKVGTLNQRRYGHEVIRVGDIAYLIGGAGQMKTEKWDLIKTETKKIEDALDHFVYFLLHPILYSVHPDQCSSCSKNCYNGYCVMVDGNEHCKCDGGYANLNDDPLETCQDINECEDFNCGEGTCRNNIGSYSCNCNQGFINAWNDQSAICGETILFNKN